MLRLVLISGGKEAVMVESKLTKVKVNNEIELCEVYDSAIKERIKKVFFREGISFYIKFKNKLQVTGLAFVALADEDRQEKQRAFREKKEGRYIICVNKSQQELARKAVERVVPDHGERIRFLDEEKKDKSEQPPVWELLIDEI